MAYSTTGLSVRADGLALESQRMRPAVPLDDTNERFVERAVPRIVMGDGRDAGQQILERADEQAVGERVGLVPSD